MKERPASLDEGDLLLHLTEGWGLRSPVLAFAPLGFGSYHWTATGSGGERHFVTVDDLDTRPWLGSDRDSAFDGLGRALATALTLRREAGLEFVAAPLAATDGATVRRVDDRYALAVAPFIEGSAGDFGALVETHDLETVVGMLARLHGATPLVEAIALRRSFEVPNRGEIEDAFGALGTPWDGGPFADRARGWLEANARPLTRLLATYDRLCERVEREHRSVITHGEPHQGNLLRSGADLFLIDWDTVSMGPPERDLWLVNGGSAEVRDLYSRLTGHQVDEAAIELYSIGWRLTDVACFLQLFRHPHQAGADTEHSWRILSAFEL